MYEGERIVVISNDEYANLITASKEVKMLRNLFEKKLNAYAGINHHELADICAMIGINEKEI